MTRMKAVTTTSALVLLVGLSVPVAAQEMPPPPTAGPAHEVLKAEAGTWDAKIEMMMPNGTTTSSGSETATIGCGGLCLVSHFKGEMMGMPFEGHGLSAYDGRKQKYVGSWTDSMSQGVMTMESTWDPAAKTMTAMMEGPDQTGQIVKMKAVSEHKDANTRVFTMYNPDGAPGMRITYTRKK